MGDKQLLYVDSMIIIECVRTNCWNALTGQYQVETVEKCRDEVLAGDLYSPGYVEVNIDHLNEDKININCVTNQQRVKFNLEVKNSEGIDDGEKDLFSYLYQKAGSWITSCSDIAAINIALSVGWKDKLIALDTLIQKTGENPNPKLKDHYYDKWLSVIKTKFLLGML